MRIDYWFKYFILPQIRFVKHPFFVVINCWVLFPLKTTQICVRKPSTLRHPTGHRYWATAHLAMIHIPRYMYDTSTVTLGSTHLPNGAFCSHSGLLWKDPTKEGPWATLFPFDFAFFVIEKKGSWHLDGNKWIWIHNNLFWMRKRGYMNTVSLREHTQMQYLNGGTVHPLCFYRPYLHIEFKWVSLKSNWNEIASCLLQKREEMGRPLLVLLSLTQSCSSVCLRRPHFDAANQIPQSRWLHNARATGNKKPTLAFLLNPPSYPNTSSPALSL